MKKYLIVLILRMLETHSDEKHPLTQVQIAKEISEKYPCDRKTVGRNIKFLREIGFPIKKTQKGFYMGNQMFSREEIELVLGLVKDSKAEGIDRDDLCERLRICLTRYYKR